MTTKKKKDVILCLRDEHGLKYFVETGTLHGETAVWAARYFDQVHTIEISKRHHDRTKRLHSKDNIHFVLGDSGQELSKVLEKLDGPALVWLDAHWSPDLKYPRPESGECPLVREIEALNADGRAHVILIDDAHMFTEGVEAVHPGVYSPADWPDLQTVRRLLGNRSVEVRDNVIVACSK